jgi:hypothetical protein
VTHLTSNRGHGKIITSPEACVRPLVIILAERPRPRKYQQYIISSIMMTEPSILDLLLGIEVLLSATEGVAVPLLDKILGENTVRYLTWMLSAFEGTGFLCTLRIISSLNGSHILSRLFNVFAI